MRTIVVAVIVGLLLLGSLGSAAAESLKPFTRMTRDLAALAGRPAVPLEAPGAAGDGFVATPLRVSGDWVTIDATAAGDPRVLEAELIALGARNTAVAGHLVSARLPIAAIPSLEGLTSLQFARPAHRKTHVGAVTSQGDRVMRADSARAVFGLDGSGVMVGVLSDSFDCFGGAATDAATGDLTAIVTVVEESNCNNDGDEGRAMMQIVHDIAPGADLAFGTAARRQ